MLPDGLREMEVGVLGDVGDSFPKTVPTMGSFGLGNENGIGTVNVLDRLLDGKGQGPVSSQSRGHRLRRCCDHRIDRRIRMV